MMQPGVSLTLLLLRRALITRLIFCKKMSAADVSPDSELNFLLKNYEQNQISLRDRIIQHDTEEWQKSRSVAESDDVEAESTGVLQYVAGMDISKLKDKDTACVALVICKLPSLKIVYKDLEIVDVKFPYVPGFLSFREAEFLIRVYQKSRKRLDSQCMPQVLLVDGNGILHNRECGLACHVGVSLDVPTIGVAKNLLTVNGIVREKEKMNTMASKGDTYPLISDSGRTLGVALKTSDEAENPVYVSVGHKISLESASWLTTRCSLYRIPEPIRQADILSREFLRVNFPEDVD